MEYVLDDWRIVDGNRRFTALRDIHQATGRRYILKRLFYRLTGLICRRINIPGITI